MTILNDIYHKDPVRSGFTLFELLATVTILALLLAMLLPTIRLARDTAKQGSCALSLRQISLAAGGYASDWRGAVVPLATDGGLWSSLLADYAQSNLKANGKNTGSIIWGCPSYRQDLQDDLYQNSGASSGMVNFKNQSTVVTGYGMNPWLNYDGTQRGITQAATDNFAHGDLRTDPLNQRKILSTFNHAAASPSCTLGFKAGQVFSTAGLSYPAGRPLFWDRNDAFARCPIYDGSASSRHVRYRRANVCFVDGHVASVRQESSAYTSSAVREADLAMKFPDLNEQ